MVWIVVGVAVVLFFLWRSSRREANTAHDYITSQAIDTDLESAGFVSGSVRYAVYRGKPYAMTGGAVVAGTGRLMSGGDGGFVCEVHDQLGCVGFKLIQPYGIATWHKQASLQSLATGFPMATVFSEMMREHAKKHPAQTDV